LVIAKDTVIEVRLPKLGVKLQGNVAYMDLSTDSFNAKAIGRDGAKIRLKLTMQNDCELINSYKETMIIGNGLYSFDSLPELALYDLTALETNIDGTLYEQFLIHSNGILGLSGDIAKAPMGIYNNAVSRGEFYLLNAPSTVASSGKISLIFSKDVNKSRIDDKTFNVSATYAIKMKWEGDNTLEISPVDGLWRIGDIIIISNTVNLYATDGTFIVPTNYLAAVTVVNGALKTKPKLWLENTGTETALNNKGDSLNLDIFDSQQTLVFRWSKTEDATSYAIYAKCFDEINYTQIQAGLALTSDSSATWNYFSASQCFEQGKQSSFFVQAKNARQHLNSDIITVLGYRPN